MQNLLIPLSKSEIAAKYRSHLWTVRTEKESFTLDNLSEYTQEHKPVQIVLTCILNSRWVSSSTSENFTLRDFFDDNEWECTLHSPPEFFQNQVNVFMEKFTPSDKLSRGFDESLANDRVTSSGQQAAVSSSSPVKLSEGVTACCMSGNEKGGAGLYGLPRRVSGYDYRYVVYGFNNSRKLPLHHRSYFNPASYYHAHVARTGCTACYNAEEYQASKFAGRAIDKKKKSLFTLLNEITKAKKGGIL